MIVVFGSINVDLVCKVASIARPGETVLAPGYEQLSGGKGANQAVAAARAGGQVRFVGAVGRDAFGDGEAETLTREGIDTSGLARVAEATGCAFITVAADGENAITVASGANRTVRAEQLPNRFDGDAPVLVLQMELPFDETAAAARAGRESGARVLLNVAPVPHGVEATALKDLLRSTDLLIVNEHELDEAAAILGVERGEPEDTAGRLARQTDLSVLATLGGAGALLVEAGGKVERFAAPRIEPIDTTGAGDTLCGVLAAGLDAGLDMATAIRRAVAAASLACLDFGARSAMPSAERIDDFLRSAR